MEVPAVASRLYFAAFVCLALLSAPAHAWLRTFAGERTALSDYVGKGEWVVVNFWASDCSICNRDAAELVGFQAANHDSGIRVLGISIDSWDKIDKARAYVTRNHLNYPSLVTDQRTAARLYYLAAQGKFVGTPSFLLYSPTGQVIAKQFGTVSRDQLESFLARAAQNEHLKP